MANRSVKGSEFFNSCNPQREVEALMFLWLSDTADKRKSGHLSLESQIGTLYNDFGLLTIQVIRAWPQARGCRVLDRSAGVGSAPEEK